MAAEVDAAQQRLASLEAEKGALQAQVADFPNECRCMHTAETVEASAQTSLQGLSSDRRCRASQLLWTADTLRLSACGAATAARPPPSRTPWSTSCAGSWPASGA